MLPLSLTETSVVVSQLHVVGKSIRGAAKPSNRILSCSKPTAVIAEGAYSYQQLFEF